MIFCFWFNGIMIVRRIERELLGREVGLEGR